MMRRILLIAALCCYAFAKHEIKLDSPERPRVSGNGGGFGKTRLLFLEYSYRGESVIYDELANKDSAPSTIVEAKYTWETLHHDQDSSIMARFRMLECISGPCGTVPDVYIDFVQGGNNLLGVYMDLNDHPNYTPEWNWLLGVANLIYTPAVNGEGDLQVVDSPYGRCVYEFGRPEDKKFRRKISQCEITGTQNYTKFSGLQVNDFTQDVWYTQNTKVDADIVVVDAVEQLLFKSPINPKWGFAAESRVHITMNNRSRNFVDRHCALESLVRDCAIENFKLTKVGDKMYENVRKGLVGVENQFASKVSAYKEHLYAMGESHTCDEHSRMFTDLMRSAQTATEAELVAAIQDPENDPVMHVLGNVLGSLGSELGLKVAKEVLLHEGPEFLDDYLFGAANSIENNEKWHKQLMYWLLEEKKSNPETYWKIANTIATVLRRRCESSPSNSNACSKGKEKIVSKFITELTDCKLDEKCLRRAFDVLGNLPIPESYQIARKYICDKSSTDVQSAALQVIKATPHKYYDSQLVGLLIKIFRDTCPTKSTIRQAQLAVDILLESVIDHQNAATLLLRSESLTPNDVERWNYFYKAVEASRNQDELKDEFWRRMRAFKVFRPNWGQRALGADSSAHHAELYEMFGYNMHLDTSTLFNDGIFTGSTLDITMKAKKREYNLFSMDISSAGLDSVMKEAETAATSDEPKAEVRLGLLGHKLPTYTVFDGHSELMSAAWNADGQTIKAFEGNAVIRAFDGAYPLLSGMSLNFSAYGAVNAKLLGSCEISLWNRDSITNIDANVSFSLDSSITLVNHGAPVRSIESQLSAVSTISSRTDVEFMEIPPELCTTLGRKSTPVRLTVTVHDHEKNKKSVKKSKSVFQGETFASERNLVEKCNHMADEHQQI